jgi:hypothetical protein
MDMQFFPFPFPMLVKTFALVALFSAYMAAPADTTPPTNLDEMLARAQVAYKAPKTTPSCSPNYWDPRYKCNISTSADNVPTIIDTLPSPKVTEFKAKVDVWAKANGLKVYAASRFQDQSLDIMFKDIQPNAEFYMVSVGEGCDWTPYAPGFKWEGYIPNKDPATPRAQDDAFSAAHKKAAKLPCVAWYIKGNDADIPNGKPVDKAVIGMMF